MRRTFFLEIDMSDDVTDDERQDIYQYIRELLSIGSGGREPVEDLPSRPPKLATFVVNDLFRVTSVVE